MNTERPQSIFRTAKGADARFARIDNTFLNDGRLSMRARGVGAYILSKPDNWVFSAKSLSSVCIEGEHALEGAICELITFGYIARKRERNHAGQIRSRLIFHEAPTATFRQSAPTATLPTVGEPTGRSTDGRQTAGVSNDGLTNDGLTNDSLKNHPPKGDDFASLSQSGTEPAPNAAKAKQPREPMIAEIMAFAGINPSEAARSKKIAARLNKALDEILEYTPAVTPHEIRLRGGRIARKWQKANTIESLAKHWPALSKPDGSYADATMRCLNTETDARVEADAKAKREAEIAANPMFADATPDWAKTGTTPPARMMEPEVPLATRHGESWLPPEEDRLGASEITPANGAPPSTPMRMLNC